MAVAERTIGISNDATKIFPLIFNLLSYVTALALSFAALYTSWYFSHSPARSKVFRFDLTVTIFRDEVIPWFTVVITTETTYSSSVITGQCNIDCMFPVESNLKSKVSVDNSVPPTFVHIDVSVMKTDGEVYQLIIDLIKDICLVTTACYCT